MSKTRRVRADKPLTVSGGQRKKAIQPEPNTIIKDLQPLEGNIERKIIISLITNNEYISWAAENFDFKTLESGTAKLIASWCLEHFNTYQEAPFRDIDTIYFEKLKAKQIDTELAEEIEEEILPGLSEEYDKKPTNTSYIIGQSSKLMHKAAIEQRKIEMETLLDEGRYDEAGELAGVEPPTATGIQVGDICFSTERVMKMDIPRPKLLMKPWLREGETTLIYASPGVGKSLLAQMIAISLGSTEYNEESCEIGEWQPKQQTGVLYIDGEMGLHEMRQRIKAFEEMGDGRQVEYVNQMQLMDQHEFELLLSSKKGINLIKKILKENPHIKVVVVDTISTLFNLESENDADSIRDKMDPFIKQMRSMGIAQIILDHSNKMGGLRGSSAKSSLAHNILNLKDADGKQQGEAWFVVKSEKQRSAGAGIKPFEICMTYDENKKLTSFETNTAKNSVQNSKQREIIAHFLHGMKVAELAKKFNTTRQTIYNHISAATQGNEPWLQDDKKTATKAGNKMMEDYFTEIGED